MALTTRPRRYRRAVLAALLMLVALMSAGAVYQAISVKRQSARFQPAGPAYIPAGVLSDDLEHLLDRAGVRPPCVLVAASVGGLVAKLFARRHPGRVAGLVFLDAAYSGALDRYLLEWTPLRAMEACAATTAARFGILRLLDPLGLRRESPSRGTWRIVPGSTHLIGNSQPHAVARAVFEVLAQAVR